MNNKVIVVISTFIAAIVLVQLVSKDQPNSTIKEDVSSVNNKPESNFIQIGNLIIQLMFWSQSTATEFLNSCIKRNRNSISFLTIHKNLMFQPPWK